MSRRSGTVEPVLKYLDSACFPSPLDAGSVSHISLKKNRTKQISLSMLFPSDNKKGINTLSETLVIMFDSVVRGHHVPQINRKQCIYFAQT